ncbi:MAG: hydantoinase B/oxoprolinase family protein [Candidatus Abyssobacteria bacterium SURF_5]|uniref:Hydantoinase B/oxoprolinase family protein n=1 Tax=Abyssobacteria bacterium (strain SURF_5) TaxID=2093360 RepID=A0A3A4NHH2_ABYX5|nr:MAG: hydantoinase B/oxoprolinase family protein [Candidatus Abyssubacteria bacterium SURF_5]
MNLFDPIKLEIFKNLFSSVADEMGVVLQRTGFSPNIKERLDFSCAVFDGAGEMVAQAAHIPVHLGSMPLSVKSAIESLEMEPGDVVILNDPFRGGTHLPDVTMVAPVFLDQNRPQFYVANRAHHADIGGLMPSSMPLSTSIYQEGLIIPPVKLVSRGKIQKDLLSVILANVRTPVEREGDISAQLAACETGSRRLFELHARYGLTELRTAASALMDYAETLMRHTIGGIPDGVYSFEDFLDDDGLGAERIPIRVAVTIQRDTASVDFTGSAPQVAGCVNAVFAITVSCVFYVFRCLTDEMVPSNAGCLRPIRVSVPEHSVVNAAPPAAVVGGNVETSQRIVDVLLGALSAAMPEKIPAASCGSMNNVSIGGYDCIRNRMFTYYETLAGGMGARPQKDGLDAVHTHMTNTMNTPVEVIETTYPLKVVQYAIRPGSGGRGRRNGGNGLVREYELLCASEVSVLSERRLFAPYGIAGGEAGRKGENLIFKDGHWQSLPPKINMQCSAGSRLRIMTPGGGGYG